MFNNYYSGLPTPLLKGGNGKLKIATMQYDCLSPLVEGDNITVEVLDNCYFLSSSTENMFVGNYNNITVSQSADNYANNLSGRANLLSGNSNKLTLLSGSYEGTGSLVVGNNNQVEIDIDGKQVLYDSALISGQNNNVTIENAQVGNEYMSICPALLSGSGNNMTINYGSFKLIELLSGSTAGTLKIYGGYFNIDPANYLVSGAISYKDYADMYNVLPTSSTMSDTFKSYLNANGELVVNRYEPKSEYEIDSLMECLWLLYAYDENWEYYEPYYLQFNRETYNLDTDEVYVSLIKTETDETIESHLVKLVFKYDTEMKSQIDSLIENIVDSTNPDEITTYNVTDMAIFNYWLTCTPENSRINSLIRFSEDFQEKIGYKNFGLDTRMGSDSPLNTFAAGIGEFSYNGIVYGVANIGVNMNHILYVPEGSSDLKAAAQARLDNYLGKGKVSLTETTLAEGIVYSVYQWGAVDFDTYEEFREAYPDHEEALLYHQYCQEGDFWSYPEFEDYKNANTAQWENYIEDSELTKDSPCYKVKINGVEHYLLIEIGTADQIKNPTFRNIDVSTEVEVTTDETEVPLDTMLQVEKLESGSEYEKIIKAIGTEDGVVYDIKLHSNSLNDYITKLDSGKFEVKLPVPAELEGKELVVYYVDSNGKVTEHTVTVKDGFAIFETDHFSIYTLAEKNTELKATDTENKDTAKSPATGDTVNIYLLLALAFVSGAVAVITKKSKA